MPNVERSSLIEQKNDFTSEPKRIEWLPKQKYAYCKLMNGLRRGSILGMRSRHIVYTTSNDPRVKGNSVRLYNDHKEVTKRIKRATPLKLVTQGYISAKDLHKYYPGKPLNEPLNFEYHRVRTIEGNGVLHIVAVGDFIPYYWLQDQWIEIHYSKNISIVEISNKNYGGRASYIVTQYISDQGSAYVRSSMSKNFIYPGWKREYDEIRNNVLHGSIKRAYRDNQFSNWQYEWYTTAELYANKLDRGKNQSVLFEVEYQTDKQMILQQWTAHLEHRVLKHVDPEPKSVVLAIIDDFLIADNQSPLNFEDSHSINTEFNSNSDKDLFPNCYQHVIIKNQEDKRPVKM